MALKTFVKIGRVNNLSDARYCAGMEVGLLGFRAEQSDDAHVSADFFHEMKEWLSGVGYVLEFGPKATALSIQEAVAAYEVEYVEVQSIDTLLSINDLKTKKILKLSEINHAVDVTQLKSLATHLEYLLIEGDDIDENSAMDIVGQLSDKIKVLVGFGITPQSVELLAQNEGVAGIAMQGGDEIRPGLKDFDELADVLEALEIDDLS